jgi:hypothetical protein
MEPVMETKPRCAGCAQKGNPLLSSAAIVASNPGDLVRGVVQVETVRRPVFSLLLARLTRLLFVCCLSAVRYLRQNFANPLYVVLSPRSKLRSAYPLDWWGRNLLSRDVPIDSRIAQPQLACSFTRGIRLHSGYTSYQI